MGVCFVLCGVFVCVRGEDVWEYEYVHQHANILWEVALVKIFSDGAVPITSLYQRVAKPDS